MQTCVKYENNPPHFNNQPSTLYAILNSEFISYCIESLEYIESNNK